MDLVSVVTVARCYQDESKSQLKKRHVVDDARRPP
jgi:hypothetical protein